MVCCMLFVVTVLSDLPLGRQAVAVPGHPQDTRPEKRYGYGKRYAKLWGIFHR
jgi:hypothetical protein